MALYTFLIIFTLMHIDRLRGDVQTVKYSSDCSVPLCTSLSYNSTTGNCSSSTVCYKFLTSSNRVVCAPRVVCSLFESCIGDGNQCSSNISVCIVNSCCITSICMPLALNHSCIDDQSTNTSSSNATSSVSSSSSVVNSTMPSVSSSSALNSTMLSVPLSSKLYSTMLSMATSSTSSPPQITTMSRITSSLPTNAALSNPSSVITTATTRHTTILACTWSSWVNGLCSVTCGAGSYTRQRLCIDASSSSCNSCATGSPTNGSRPCFYPLCIST